MNLNHLHPTIQCGQVVSEYCPVRLTQLRGGLHPAFPISTIVRLLGLFGLLLLLVLHLLVFLLVLRFAALLGLLRLVYCQM